MAAKAAMCSLRTRKRLSCQGLANFSVRDNSRQSANQGIKSKVQAFPGQIFCGAIRGLIGRAPGQQKVAFLDTSG